jgi:hypothetical protein
MCFLIAVGLLILKPDLAMIPVVRSKEQLGAGVKFEIEFTEPWHLGKARASISRGRDFHLVETHHSAALSASLHIAAL